MSIQEGILKLLQVSKEHGGYVTYDDINSVFPDAVFSVEDLDEVVIELRQMDVEILNHA